MEKDGKKNVGKLRFIYLFLKLCESIISRPTQNLRPEVFPRENIFTYFLGLIYKFDTNTGVFPSMHVAFSLAVVSVALKDNELAGAVKTLICVLVILICMAVCFVKQHSVLDVLGALPVSIAAEIMVYGKEYWLPRIRRRSMEILHD